MTVNREENWSASFLSWGGLLLAGTLFAISALAPRLEHLHELHERYAAGQAQLVFLEKQTESLEGVCEALRTDPLFTDELAKLELSAVGRGTESIAVRPELRLGVENASADTGSEARLASSQQLARATVMWISARPKVRAGMLACAAAIGLMSLIGVRPEQVESARSLVRWLRRPFVEIVARYRRC